MISNKQGPLLRAEAAHLGWAGQFRSLVGAGDAAADKPDPAPFALALPALGLAAGPAVWYVGDTALDMQAARQPAAPRSCWAMRRMMAGWPRRRRNLHSPMRWR